MLFEPGRPMTVETLDLAEPRAGEVLIELVASGVCHSCLNVATGVQTRAPKPIVLGDEGSGIVREVGPGVSRLQVGDHVILSWAPGCGRCRSCDRGRPVLCANEPPLGFMADGTTRFSLGGRAVHHLGPSTYATHAVVSDRAAIAIPSDFPLEEAALIGCSVTTGVGAVLNTAAVKAGQAVAVFGCGGVGLNAVQGAAIAGATPIVAIDPVADRLAMARSLGATDVLDPGDVDGVPEAILELTGEGVDCAVVAVGSAPVLSDALRALAPGGAAVMVGVLPAGEELHVDPGPLVGGERRLLGSKYGSANPAVEFPRMVELAAAGRLRLADLITRRYSIDEANEAFADLQAGVLARGLIVL